ncbi:ORF6N domain-containing protein [Butyrivibrio sp. FCS006]|uniref:ORF6N domain-containing protein n=1 Tax=Butyrivibrio sp. FCS006 TaxID=1280684 RepID=UPI0009DBD963|nr:ORF6N domain-containing protein [Butyrivibrio sp. FCS006]
MFQLTREEVDLVKSQNATSRNDSFFEGQDGGRRKMPYVFTEQGIYMLATVLRGELAEQQSIFIMRAFKEMRHYIRQNQQFVTQSEMSMVTAKVSELSVQMAGAIDHQKKTDKAIEDIQKSIDRKDGTKYSDYFYYGCKHRNMTRGHKCDYRKQVSETKLDGAVIEVLRKLVSNKKFAGMMREKINMEVDTSALDQEISAQEKTLRQSYLNKDAILSDLDNLDYEDKHYKRRKADLEDRLSKTYDKIEEIENALVEAKAKKRSILAEKVCGDNIYKALIFFDKMYEPMNEAERREFLTQFIEKVEIYEEEQENGQWLKSIEFKLPIISKDMKISLDNGSQIETVVLLMKTTDKEV